ncbi:MAG: 4Fe-4S binding protein, partial [Flavobacteriales bacterium]|nr:4Fe-4S binding protein [Flavobacteriales bacterium]
MAKNNHPDYSKYRAWTLLSVWIFFALHMVHWRYNETTLAPLELNEVLYTLHQGIVTAGFILMVVIMIATLIFGRFFCSWGCHILSLQDACFWILGKLKIRSRPIRSRALIWVPMGAMLYLFVWPQILMYFHGIETEALHVVENTDGQWSSFVTDDFWRNLPPVEIALGTFFIVGFVLVYLLGSRSFCYYGCPYGALFGLADQVAPGRIKLTGDCKQCGVCTVNCGSDILVHKEIKEYGMVTNSKCFKDLDCIAGCPENALSFGFITPPLFKSKYKLPDYKNRYSFTIAEDILLAVVFVFSVFVFRGLYGMIPFLMSVGMSVATAYVSLLTLRLFTRSSTSIN